MMQIFLDRGLPAAAVLDDQTAPVVQFPQMRAQYESLLEVLAPAPNVAGEPRFAQARGAAEQRKKLDRILPASIPTVGMINVTDQQGLDISAFRSAGFRGIMHIDGNKATDVVTVGRRQIEINGGVMLDTSPSAPTLTHQFDGLVAGGQSLVVVLPLGDMDSARAADLNDQIIRLANNLENRVREGALVMVRPMDHLLLSGVNPARLTAVVIEVNAGSMPAAREVISRAEQNGIPITIAAPRDILARLGRPDACQLLPSPASGSAPNLRPVDPVLAKCVMVNDDDHLTDLGASEIVLRRTAAATHRSLIDADGRLHVTIAPWNTLTTQASVLADPVVLIAASDYGTPRQRDSIFRRLAAEGINGRAWLRSVDDWADHITAPDPIFARFRRVRRRSVTDPKPTAEATMSARDVAMFMDDAKAAWAYIANQTVAETGLAVTTVQTVTDPKSKRQFDNSEATLWDLGSQILGILAAGALGLIDQPERDNRIARILAHIPVITINGARLPPAIFSVRQLRIIRPDFDICDLGRFLVALDHAVAAGAVTQADADGLIDGWDIGVAIRDGRFHSYRSGRWVDITVSHCTDYMVRAFRARGFVVENIFPETPMPLDVDKKMQILAIAANAGAIGAEPLLLDVVEGGQSRVAAYLADVLFDAQLDWFSQTGRYRSPSEVPLNRAPWFLYQGLHLERSGTDAWAINSIDPSRIYQTAEFREQTEVVVAKSAYLWRAARPHPYSDGLTTLIRDKCRVPETGFTVGVFADTYAPLERYFDINTNAIILTALAHMLV